MLRRFASLAAATIAVAACTAHRGNDTTAAAGSSATATQAGTPAPAAIRQNIEAAGARFAAAIDKGDTATVGALYADDAALLMPGMKVVHGRAPIAKAFGDMLGSVKFSGTKLTTDDVMTGGDLAVETGHYEWTLTPKGGKAAHETGKYVTVWQHQADGSYKIVRDIANADPAEKK